MISNQRQKTFSEAVLTRRSMYELDDQIEVDFEVIKDVITQTQLNAPTAMNSQSARLIVLTGKAHRKHWDEVAKILAARIPAERFAKTAKKLAKFQAAYGTILFFEDMQTVGQLQHDYPTYAATYLDWSHQANGMLQFALWAELEALGLGASIQHYTPLIDERVRELWQAPAEWQLITEMVFGNPIAPAQPKSLLPIETRLIFIENE